MDILEFFGKYVHERNVSNAVVVKTLDLTSGSYDTGNTCTREISQMQCND